MADDGNFNLVKANLRQILLSSVMDSIDRQILRELQLDGRLANQDLAERVGLSPSPTLRRVRRLEESGIIAAYQAVIDAGQLGLKVLAFVELTLGEHSTPTVEAVERSLVANESIIEAHMLAGDADYLVKVVVEDLEGFEHFIVHDIRAIPHLASVRSHFAFGTVKATAPVLPSTRPQRRRAAGRP